MPDYRGWNFKTSPVDGSIAPGGDAGYVGSNYISSESVLICAGPTKFSGMEKIIPIGVIQNFNLGQNRNIQQFFEIGSKDTILLPGKVFSQATLSRILFNGPSLLKALTDLNTSDDEELFGEGESAYYTQYRLAKSNLGNNQFLVNIADHVFDLPIGLALIMHSVDDNIYGGVYLENTFVNTHNLSLAAGQTIIAESISLRIGKVVPIELESSVPDEE